MTHPTPASAPAASRRPRYQARSRTRWERIPFLAKVLVPVAVASIGWWSWQWSLRNRAEVTFVRADGQPVPPLELTLYSDAMSFAAPSPPPPLAAATLAEGDSIALGAEHVPGSAYLRYRGAGVGAGYVPVRLGKAEEPVVLHPPGRLPGRVGEVVLTWMFGWRSLGLRPVADAEVLGIGGGELGVPLCDARTDAEGRFELRDFDSGLPAIGLRVRKAGYAIAWQDWRLAKKDQGPIVALVPTSPIRGRVVAPPDLPIHGHLLLARGLPGVSTTIGEDGAFALDHVPPGLEPKLLVHDLPVAFTHLETRGKVGGPEVELTILRAATVTGLVVDETMQRPMPDAVVWHQHGPSGMTAVKTDARGRFVVDRVPPGELVLGAHWEEHVPGRRAVHLAGQRVFVVQEGERLENIIIRIE